MSFFRETLAGRPGYEVRWPQLQMVGQVAQAIEQEEFLVVEAGTGTGKSLAYLVPALLWATRVGQPVVVSTRTIALQQQLFYKDVPALAELLDHPFRAVLARGWSNYVCLRRLHGLPGSGELSIDLEVAARNLQGLLAGGAPGVLQDLRVEPALWSRIHCDSAACGRQTCPWFDDCYFFRERRQLEGADLIVTNHSLLMADLALRRQGAPGLLPRHAALILDEGHHLEDVATQHLGCAFGELHLSRLTRQLYDPTTHLEKSGLFPGLRQRIASLPIGSELRRGLLADVDHRMLAAMPSLSAAGEEFFEVLRLLFAEGDSRRLVTESDFQTDVGLELRRVGAVLAGQLNQLGDTVKAVGQRLVDLELPGSVESAVELSGQASRLRQTAAALEFCLFPDSEDWVYWGHQSPRDAGLTATPLDVGQVLADELFSRSRSVVVTSATLAVRGDLRFFSERVGLQQHDERLVTNCLDSPFDFHRQVYLGVATDLPPPGARMFAPAVTPGILELVSRLRGKTFLLVTSWSLVRQFERELRTRLAERGICLLVQGEADGRTLLETFRSDGDYVLLGTDSFWEGVDVPGDNLRCVVLAKLPFRVPTDPIIAAHSRRLQREGRNPFQEYQLPLAVLKFRQGFGRLIRTASDRGLVLVLDGRIRTKTYGKDFLGSLPACTRRAGPLGGLVEEGLAWLDQDRASAGGETSLQPHGLKVQRSTQ